MHLSDSRVSRYVLIAIVLFAFLDSRSKIKCWFVLYKIVDFFPRVSHIIIKLDKLLLIIIKFHSMLPKFSSLCISPQIIISIRPRLIKFIFTKWNLENGTFYRFYDTDEVRLGNWLLKLYNLLFQCPFDGPSKYVHEKSFFIQMQ